MSTARPTNESSPGGKPQPTATVPVLDEADALFSEFSWSAPTKQQPAAPRVCSCAPNKACTCEAPFAPSTPPAQRYADDLPLPCTPPRARCSSRSRGSDSTVSAIFERPAADPQVSPTQLPALCDDADSDDELFVQDTKDADGTKDEDTPGTTYVSAPGDGDLRLLSLASFCASMLTRADFPQPEHDSLISTAFDFMAPYVPPSPLFAEARETAAGALVLVACRSFNRHQKSHARPSDEDRYHSNPEIMAYLTQSVDKISNAKLHSLLRDQSNAPDARSYAQAPPYIQRHVRELLIRHPTWHPDAVTPTERLLADPPTRCVFANCKVSIPPTATATASTTHIRNCHWPAGEDYTAGRTHTVACPLCPHKAKMQLGSLGRHIFSQHAADRPLIPLKCKLCEHECFSISEFAEEHFPKCQAAFTRDPEPPHKKQRLH
ncbi:hypothetical protein DFH09DRAFT_1370143 [Mycena vulgaris]|nr:hypothetical protein DFH09DRAFT_1370143 [Mycena vulgaris]